MLKGTQSILNSLIFAVSFKTMFAWPNDKMLQKISFLPFVFAERKLLESQKKRVSHSILPHLKVHEENHTCSPVEILGKQSKSRRASFIHTLNSLTVSETREIKGTSAFSFCPIPLSLSPTTAGAGRGERSVRLQLPGETHYIDNIFSHATCFGVAFEKADN